MFNRVRGRPFFGGAAGSKPVGPTEKGIGPWEKNSVGLKKKTRANDCKWEEAGGAPPPDERGGGRTAQEKNMTRKESIRNDKTRGEASIKSIERESLTNTNEDEGNLRRKE